MRAHEKFKTVYQVKLLRNGSPVNFIDIKYVAQPEKCVEILFLPNSYFNNTFGYDEKFFLLFLTY